MRPIDADALIEFCAERWIPLNIDAVNMQPTIQPEKAQLYKEGTTKDTISRQAAIDEIKSVYEWHDKVTMERLVEHINNLPTVQSEPQEGHWINGKCDLCGEHAPFWCMASTYHESNYCPNCGAKMTISTK